MFTNEFNDSFGKTYSSDTYEKAQTANKWSLAYTLLYALSKNGMKYASNKTGKCSVINNTSLAPVCKIVGTPTNTSGSLMITFKRLCLKINVVTSTDGKHAFPSGIFITDTNGKTLGTLCKYDSSGIASDLQWSDSKSTVVYGPNCDFICNWSNNPDTDEGKFRVQTATFKDSKNSYDIVSMHFWAESIYLGAISIFKAKDYFSSKYKYGFGLYKALDDVTVYKFSDGTACELHPIFENAGTFPNQIAKTCFFTGDQFAGLVGGINGIYQITDENTVVSLFPENKISINGRDFQAISPGLFARTS